MEKQILLNCRRGMTLIELIIVIAILASIAFLAMSAVDSGSSHNQIRYEDTRIRMKAIREAIIGPTGKAIYEHGVLSGFVVDNGRLPGNVTMLVDNPASAYDSYKLVSPIFDPSPTSGFNDGSGETSLQNAVQRLLKGHRGYYLTGSRDGPYRDGWGNRGLSTPSPFNCPSKSTHDTYPPSSGNDKESDNHGWCVSLNATATTGIYPGGRKDFYLDSYGLDGVRGNTTDAPYTVDMILPEPVLADDWSMDISGRTVTVNDPDGTVFGNATLATLKASLLVFVNDSNPLSTNGNWLQIPTKANATVIPANGTIPLRFPALSHRVPVGEHLLVLTGNSTATPHHVLPNATSSKAYTTRVRFFPRSNPPAMEINIP